MDQRQRTSPLPSFQVEIVVVKDGLKAGKHQGCHHISPRDFLPGALQVPRLEGLKDSQMVSPNADGDVR
ncbi:hypothetical protein [Antarcticimicrobium luteum]|uniref:Uncharacterized protein n=1 Tax=Antarcticimicrobium luteum TaxID=2547397 RepID=A0A4R5VG14_9RHOB|nr:hypothetical protein [Antarcticimicrobium luteum]TDK51288.1 hypothetical protein E1832_03945 [Antarcticimicrobium luteum]